MKHAPEYLEMMARLEPFLRKGKFSEWSFETICDWIAYFWNRGTLSFVIDVGGKVHGVCLIKLFSRLEQFLEPFVHEPSGRFCMIELMVADGSRAMGAICDELVDRFGPHDLVLWDRGERTENGAPRIYRWEDFQTLARRITKNG